MATLLILSKPFRSCKKLLQNSLITHNSTDLYDLRRHIRLFKAPCSVDFGVEQLKGIVQANKTKQLVILWYRYISKAVGKVYQQDFMIGSGKSLQETKRSQEIKIAASFRKPLQQQRENNYLTRTAVMTRQLFFLSLLPTQAHTHTLFLSLSCGSFKYFH